MAIISCPECGKKISDRAFSCPDCGCPINAAPAVSAPETPKVNIANMLTLAQNAIDQSNNSEAEDYANRVLEVDSNNAQAWLIKGQAVGWQSTLRNVRFSEMASCFEHAMENVSEEDKDEYKQVMQSNAQNVAKAFLTLATDNFSNYPSDDNVSDIQLAITSMLDLSIKMILMHVEWDTDGINDFFSQKINGAAVAGSNKADADFGPDRSDKNKYAYERWIKQSDWCLDILKKALIFAHNKERVETIVKNYRVINTDMINSCSYKFEATGYWSGYVQDTSLTDLAKNLRRTAIKNVEDEGKKKIKELTDKAREKYWNAHPELKESLENEKKEKTARIAVLEKEIKEIKERVKPEIEKLNKQYRENLPEEIAVAEQKKVIDGLNDEIKSLGLFKGKEKKELKARINDVEQPKLEQLQAVAKEKRTAANREIDKKINDLRNEDKPQQNELTKCKARIKEIDREFTKDR